MSSKQKHNSDLVDAPELVSTPRSGRVTWDERGNSVWEWQTAPGVFTREVSSEQLEALEASDLRIVDLDPRNARPLSGRVYTGAARPRKRDKSVLEKFLCRLGLPA